jgi:hypothetical protein
MKGGQVLISCLIEAHARIATQAHVISPLATTATKRLTWAVVMGGCHGRLSWAVVMGGCHGQTGF